MSDFNNVNYNLPCTNNGNERFYPFSMTRSSVIKYFDDELSDYELKVALLNAFNEMSNNYESFVNTVNSLITGKEDSVNITNNRKLSEDGDFTGTLCNKKMTACEAVYNIDNNRDMIKYLLDGLIDGQNGIQIDGGFFTENDIKWNYDGGRF